MKEELEVRWRREVAILLPEVEVRDHEGLGDGGLSEILVLMWEKDKSGPDEDAERHEGGGGKDSANAALPKSFHSEVTADDVFGDDGGDEVAGDDEENINAYKASGESERGVEEDHRNDCEGAEAVDIRTVAEVFQAGGVEIHD